MDTVQKIALFREVAANSKQPSDLREALDGDENFIHFAVEHIVSERLQQTAANQRLFRFKIVETELSDEMEEIEVNGEKRLQQKRVQRETFTDWEPEVSQFSAPMAIGYVRQLHPTAAISVERK